MNRGETSSHSRGPVLALTADLLFASRVKSTAAAVGTDLVLVRTADEMLRQAAQLSPRLIVIDLDIRTLNPIDLITRLKADPASSKPPVLAYVSHVREDLIGAARDAGVDQVMARGAFSKNLASILSA
ncbi:MAG: response regulator [Gemmatimonadota bacterium]